MLLIGKQVSTEAILEKLFDLEDGIKASNSDNSQPKEAKSKKLKSKRKPEKKKTIQEEIKEKEREVERFRSRLQCKVCLDEQVGTLFLPCRHLICCVNCAVSVNKCPLCREKIIGTIKTFVNDNPEEVAAS